VRIAFISVFPPARDGVADYSFYLVKSIEDASSDCVLYVMAPTLDGKRSVTRMSNHTTLFRIWKMNSSKNMMKSIITLAKAIVAVKADVVHIQYRFTREQGGSAGEPFLALMLIIRGIARKTKIVVSLHDFWLPNEAEQRVRELTRSKLLAKLYRYYYVAYTRAVLSIPNSIISVVNSKKSPVTTLIKSNTKREVVEVLHGLPEASTHPAGRKASLTTKMSIAELGADSKFTVVLYGFIRRSKGYHYVIRAMKQIVTSHSDMKGKVRLLIAGTLASSEEEPYLNYLKRLIRELGLENIVEIVEKYLEEDEISSLFEVADVTVIPYTRRVGPSGVFASALSYEVPAIITSDSKYITDDMGLPALTVNLDIDEIASAVLRLMNDKREYARQVQKIREYKKLHSNEMIALSHVKIYEKSLHRSQEGTVGSPDSN
jgi:glycosyltransferase involved in cell wall biosynthesis